MNRRELLKLTPVIALGAFAIPPLQTPLLKAGVGFSDWASGVLFRHGHLAPTFADSEVAPFEKFPINDYDVDDPEVDLTNWKLDGCRLGAKAWSLHTCASSDACPSAPRTRAMFVLKDGT